MDLSFRRLSLNAIFSWDNVNPEKGVSATSFSLMSVLVEICSINIVGVSSSRFLLAKRWFSSSPCFLFRFKKGR